MKKMIVILILLVSNSVFPQAYDEITSSNPTNLYDRYSLPGVYSSDYRMQYRLNNEYSEYEYPYFFYPFNFKKDRDESYLHAPLKNNYSDRYQCASTITAYQPEFNMLKRFFCPGKFNYKQLLHPKGVCDGNEVYCPGVFGNIAGGKGGGQEPNNDVVFWGERQGFTKPIFIDEFNFYIASNKDFRFLIAIPKDISIDKFKKFPDANILYLGAIYDEKVYENVPLYGILSPYYIIDYVVLYDKRYCKYNVQ